MSSATAVAAPDPDDEFEVIADADHAKIQSYIDTAMSATQIAAMGTAVISKMLVGIYEGTYKVQNASQASKVIEVATRCLKDVDTAAIEEAVKRLSPDGRKAALDDIRAQARGEMAG